MLYVTGPWHHVVGTFLDAMIIRHYDRRSMEGKVCNIIEYKLKSSAVFRAPFGHTCCRHYVSIEETNIIYNERHLILEYH